MKKLLIWGGIIGAGVWGINKLVKGKKAQNVGDKMTMAIKDVDVNIIGLQKIKVKAKLHLQNPTKDGMTITKPFFKVFYNNNLIGSSAALENKTYPLPPMDTLTLPESVIEMNTLMTILNAATGGGSTKIKLSYSLYANNFSHETEMEYDLKNLLPI